MKPLKNELTVVGTITSKQIRDCLVDLARQPFGCCVRYKDGTFHQVTIDSNDEIKIEDYDPWFECENENELKKYIETNNEEFYNFVRWQELQNIFDDEEINDDIFEK